jgi:putative spermidine/putrescine transport system substrate-binding protein
MEKSNLRKEAQGLSRRNFLKMFLIAAAVSICSFPLVGLAAEEKVLVVQTWGGEIKQVMKDVLFDPFTKETGIKVITADATGSIMAQVKAQVESKNVEWDLASGLGEYSINLLVKDNLLDPMDYSIVSKKDIIEGAFKPYAAACWVLGVNLLYNTNKFKGDNYPKSWADFWNVKKFPGPRTLTGVPFSAVMYNLAFAQIADGVPIDKLYPYDLDRAFKKMDEIRPHVKAWWTSGGHSQQLFTDEEVWLGSIYSGRGMMLEKKGVPVKLVWNEGAYDFDHWAVLKNAPHKKTAMEFINFVSQPKPQAEFARRMYYGPINAKSFDLLSEDVAKDLNTYPANKNKQFVPNHKWVGEHLKDFMERWEKWVAK